MKCVPHVEVLEQIDLGLLKDFIETCPSKNRRTRTMISPSSAFGILLSCISFTATVSPVAQFKAPATVVSRVRQVRWVTLTIHLSESSFAQRIAQLLSGASAAYSIQELQYAQNR